MLRRRNIVVLTTVGGLLLAAGAGPAAAGERGQELAKLTASTPVPNEMFGRVVSISGNYAVIAAGYHTPSSCAFVFWYDGATWVQQARLTIGEASASFGYDVATDGDRIVVGAAEYGGGYGSAYVFRRNDNGTPDAPADDTWPLEQSFYGCCLWHNFGMGVAIDGNLLVVGSASNLITGYAFVYEYNGASWVHKGTLTASDGFVYNRFGFYSSISGNTILVSASMAHAAYVFEKPAGGWTTMTETAKLPDGGYFVHASISGDYAVVGAHDDNNWTGAAYVYYRNQGGSGHWGQQAKLTASDGTQNDFFGVIVGIHGEYIVVGAHGDDDGCPPENPDCNTGSAYLFKRTGTSWSEQAKLVASDGAPGDRFGVHVSIGENYILVAAPYDDDGGTDTGSAYVFAITGPDTDGDGIPDAQDNCPSLPNPDQADCDADGTGDACAIASGTSQDCNSNGIPDECDIAAGTSQDCQPDGIPDECDGQIVYDHFDDGILDPSWSISFENATGWTYSESGTLLTVTDISTVSDYTWAVVKLSRICSPLGDFHIDFNVSWDSEASISAEQFIFVSFYTGTDDLVALCGYNDSWVAHRGAKYVWVADYGEWDSGYDTLPYAGSASLSIDRTGETMAFFWNGSLLVTRICAQPVEKVELSFGWYAKSGGWGGSSFFGSESIDLIRIIGSAPDCNSNGVPDECEPDCNTNGMPDECDMASGASQDCNSNGIPDECDLAASTSQDANHNGTPDECDLVAPIWTLRATTGPAPRGGAAMAYDSSRGVVVLFGGSTTTHGYDGETWEWDGNTWTLRASAGPSPRADHAMAYDSARGVVVLFGGGRPHSLPYYNDTWEWNGSTWALRATTGPSPRICHAMACDSQRNVVVLFGGHSGPYGSETWYGDTWEWDGSTWTLRSSSGPSSRTFHAMAYDSNRGVVVLFGGSHWPNFYSDTWEWDGNAWSQRPATGPSRRTNHAMAYDSASRVTVLFGGAYQSAVCGDTWEWDGSTWTLQPITGPSPRYYHAMAYDAIRAVVVLFGGGDLTTTFGETWEYGPGSDCNANGILDTQDIAAGTSQDCNTNGIPDECDLAAGTSQDCQTNGIPDECDIAVPTEVRLAAADAAAGDQFGLGLATDEDTLVVGAWHDDHSGFTDAGSAYVFVRSGDAWVQQAKLIAGDPGADDQFGAAVTIQGDTIAVGAYTDDHSGLTNAGSVYVFTRSGGTWSQAAWLKAPDAVSWAKFGAAVALDGDTLLIGASADTHHGLAYAGSAYVFVGGGATWTYQAKLMANDPGVNDCLGSSVALDGDTALLGAPGDDHSGFQDAGSAYVFVRSNGEWTQQAKLIASVPSSAEFGVVGLDGGRAVIGAYLDDHAGGTDAGSAYVFVRDGSAWAQLTQLKAFDAAAGDNFGNPVWIEGNTIGVGAAGDDHTGLTDAGSAYLFYFAGTWTQGPKITATDAAANDRFGIRVAIQGKMVLVGADKDDHAGGTDAGSVYVFAPGLDCNGNGIPDECDVASGASQDCNSNGMPDECDIAGGTSPDHNANGIPDECEPDCNGNGIPDSQDIAAGTSPDCNTNGVPDECDLAAGTSQDCQPNGTPDECDFAAPGAGFFGTSSWATFDPGEHGVGNDPKGYVGAVFDGRYVYFVPHARGSWSYHGEVLRYDTTGQFSSVSSWAAYDPGDHGVGTDPDGYYGAVFDGRYVYFVPCYQGYYHGEVLRYDTAEEFSNVSSWATYDAGAHGVGTDPDGYAGAVFDGRYVYFVPVHNGSNDHGEVLRYDTFASFANASSWATYDAGANGVGNDPDGYHGAVFDGRYVYFAPLHNGSEYHGEVLRYDTFASFADASSWAAYDAGAHGVGKDPDGYNGAVFDGRYVYFVPYANDPNSFHGEVLRYDTGGDFLDASSWTAFDPGDHGVGNDPDGYRGAAFDGRYIYFVPTENGSDFHGEVLRYDTIGGFSAVSSWATYDPGAHGVGNDPDGYIGAAFDGRYVYFAPAYNGSELHGEVLRYDTRGGSSPDCNGNGVPDECDVASGASQDCNSNGIPDECDIAGGTSPDHNANGVPDECEAEPSATLNLNPEAACYKTTPPGNSVVVTVDLTDANTIILGGQFFLHYNTAVLEFVSLVPGGPPFTSEIYEAVDAVQGTIDYAVGIEAGGAGTSADATMAVIAFHALTEVCAGEGLVTFRPHVPPTKLTGEQNDQAVLILPTTVDLPAVTIDGTPPAITFCPADRNVHADAGVCTARVDPGVALAEDACGGVTVAGTRSDGAALEAPYPAGTTTITWQASDGCGNVSTCAQHITVDGLNELLVNVQLSPTMESPPEGLTRCVTFELFNCLGGPITVAQEVTFINGLATGVSVPVPCGDYTCITAHDKLHTLRGTLQRPGAGFEIVGTKYAADFTGNPASGGNWLINGDLWEDGWVDIMDFGVFIVAWADSYDSDGDLIPDGDTTCLTPYPHADISGDGLVTLAEFTFIQLNFLLGDEPDCCRTLVHGWTARDSVRRGPLSQVSVVQLRSLGLSALIRADLNQDGMVDSSDMVAFLLGARPGPAGAPGFMLDNPAAEVVHNVEAQR